MVRASPDVIGRGWAFPFDVNSRGGIAMVGGDEEIRQAIIMIVRTRRGGRVMRPEFGCRIWELLFAPNNAATWTLAEHHVREALGMWEPRIEVESVRALPSPDDPAVVEVEVEYQVKPTHDARSLVFPFYLIPGEPETVAATNETAAALLEPPGRPAASLPAAGLTPGLPLATNGNGATAQVARPAQEGPR
jgi:phage baseplate assembly protein W